MKPFKSELKLFALIFLVHIISFLHICNAEIVNSDKNILEKSEIKAKSNKINSPNNKSTEFAINSNEVILRKLEKSMKVLHKKTINNNWNTVFN